MPLNTKKLQEDINKIFEQSATEAFKKTYDVNTDFVTTEMSKHKNISTQRMSEIMKTVRDTISAEFGKEFAERAARDMSKAMLAFVKSATVQHTLVAPNGNVTGNITLR